MHLKNIFIILFMIFTTSVASTPQNITIYTAPFAPFSLNGKGYSIDFVNEMVKRLWGNVPTVTVVSGSNNDFIFDSTLSHQATLDSFAIGISGITITSEREKRMDFLPAYFESGFQVATHSSTTFEDVSKRLVVNFFTVVGFFIVIVLFIMSVFAPLAFFFETMFPDIDARDGKPFLPIFIDFFAGREHSSLFVKMGRDLFRTVSWVTSTLVGTQTDYPVSKYSRVIHVLLKAIGGLLFVTLVASMSVVFSTSTQSTTVNSYADLGGHSVCTTTNTTSSTFLNSNQLGFNILYSDTSDEMMEKFWEKQCDAVVYDFPFLQQSITDNGGSAILVGPVFNKERYGALVKPSNPYEEELKQITVELTNDRDFTQLLNHRWFSNVDSHDNSSLVIPLWMKIVPAFIGIGIMVLLGLYMRKHYNDKDLDYMAKKNDDSDNNFSDDLNMHENDDLSESIYYGNDWILSKKLLPYIHKTLRILLLNRVEKELEQKRKQEQANSNVPQYVPAQREVYVNLPRMVVEE